MFVVFSCFLHLVWRQKSILSIYLYIYICACLCYFVFSLCDACVVSIYLCNGLCLSPAKSHEKTNKALLSFFLVFASCLASRTYFVNIYIYIYIYICVCVCACVLFCFSICDAGFVSINTVLSSRFRRQLHQNIVNTNTFVVASYWKPFKKTALSSFVLFFATCLAAGKLFGQYLYIYIYIYTFTYIYIHIYMCVFVILFFLFVTLVL